MARQPQELTEFSTLPTPVGEESGALLWVPERKVREGNIPARGTTLKDFMAGKVSKGDAVGRGFGDYVFTRQGDLADGWRGFYFAKARTAEQIAMAYQTEEEIRLGIFWPAVLASGTSSNIRSYNDAGGAYVSGTAYKFTYAKPAYDGPTRVVTEFFASHAPFSIGTPAGMQPTPCTLDYAIGSISIPACLHGEVTLEYTIPSDHPNYEGKTFSSTTPATVPATRPSTLVMSDGYRFENGVYIRRKETAYAP